MDIKPLPQNKSAEDDLLSLMLKSKEAIDDVIGYLSPSDFYTTKGRLIYEAIISLYDNDVVVDVRSLYEKVKESGNKNIEGIGTYIAETLDLTFSASNAMHYAEKIKEKSIKRKIIEVTQKLLNDAYTDEKSSNEILNDAQQRILSVSLPSSSNTYSTLDEVVSKTIDDLENIYKSGGKNSGILSGYSEIDTITSGFQKKNLIIIAARPGVGKSAISINMVDNIVCSGIPAAFFTLEMTKEEVVRRILSRHANINTMRFLNANFTKEMWTRLSDSQKKLYGKNLIINECSGVHYMDIRREVRRYVRQHGIKIVFIDYLGLVSGDREYGNKVQEVSSITKNFKIMAMENDIPVVALCQLNRLTETRAIKDARPKLSDLRDSGSIEQDANVVCFLHRPGMYDDTVQNEFETEFIIKKNRNGPIGYLKLDFIKELTTFNQKDIL